MDMRAVFKSLHGMLDESSLIPITEMPSEVMKERQLTAEQIERISTNLGKGVKEHLYYNVDDVLSPFCYWDKYFFYNFFNFPSLATIKSFEIEQFKHGRNLYKNMVDKKEWINLIQLSDKKVSFLVFFKVLEDIPKEDHKKLFLDVYSRNEYGFNQLCKETIRTILSAEGDNLVPFEYVPNEKGILTVYRGAGVQSTPLDSAYSWTLDYETARFFSDRFDSKGKIYKAQVHIDKIRAFITGRDESEVLLFPEDLINVSVL